MAVTGWDTMAVMPMRRQRTKPKCALWPIPCRAGSAHEPLAVPVADPETDTELGRPWNVIVWDDPINLMSYVVYVFQRLFGFNKSLAMIKMREVHEEGRSIVATTDREEAEYFVTRLHGYGLQSTMEQVDA